MIMVPQEAALAVHGEGEEPSGFQNPGEFQDSSRIISLRKKLNDEDYLCEAIQRMALVLSNEIIDSSQGGTNERKQQRKGRQ
jgi:hypothetical protein